MEIKLTQYQKITLTLFCFSIAILGFMLKLPKVFRHHDKELHSMFYFAAALFLNVLFKKRHLQIFIFLSLLGVAIEFVQEYSNKFWPPPKHGRFDIEDIFSNIKGLILFSIVWILINFISYLLKSDNKQTTIFGFLKNSK